MTHLAQVRRYGLAAVLAALLSTAAPARADEDAVSLSLDETHINGVFSWMAGLGIMEYWKIDPFNHYDYGEFIHAEVAGGSAANAPEIDFLAYNNNNYTKGKLTLSIPYIGDGHGGIYGHGRVYTAWPIGYVQAAACVWGNVTQEVSLVQWPSGRFFTTQTLGNTLAINVHNSDPFGWIDRILGDLLNDVRFSQVIPVSFFESLPFSPRLWTTSTKAYIGMLLSQVNAQACGDNACEGTETASTCPWDCSPTGVPQCGDGVCQTFAPAWECYTRCPTDCGSNVACGAPPPPKQEEEEAGF